MLSAGSLRGSPAAIAERLRTTLFTPPAGAPRIGAEVEWLVLDAETRAPLSLYARLLPFLHVHGAARGWTIEEAPKGGPRCVLPNGGAIAIEPGGQLEYASPPFRTPGELIRDVRALIVPLEAAASERGIALVGCGIDPYNALESAPLQVAAARYRRMDAYFASIGTAGQRMMRQTAALQLNVDPSLGLEPTWRVLNAAAPVLVAAFANSRMHAGRDTGCASFRAETWRRADPSRTGLLPCERPAHEEYASFALCARAMFIHAGSTVYPPFRDCMGPEGAGDAAFETHLSTLFPEIRPKSYLEIRSIDAQATDWLGVPILFVAALTSDATALAEAGEALGEPDAARLETAGRLGLRDAWLRDRSRDLFDVAMRACVRQGTAWFGCENLERLQAFEDRFVRRGLSPADG